VKDCNSVRKNYKNTLKQLENKIDDKRAIVAAAVAA
jgi:hypothetical protein